MDTREGITYNDVALYNWLTIHQMQLKNSDIKKRKSQLNVNTPTMEEYEEGIVVEDQEVLQAKILDVTKQDNKEGQELDPLEKQKMQEKKDNKDRKYMREEKAKKLQQNF